MTDLVLLGFLLFIAILTYVAFTTRATLISLVCMVFCIVLAVEVASWYSIGFVALALVHLVNTYWGFRQ